MKVLTNKKKIANAINKKLGSNFTIGCWDKDIEKLNQNNLKNIIENLGETTNVLVNLNRKKFICEMNNIDSELDFRLISRENYISKYGYDPYLEDDE